MSGPARRALQFEIPEAYQGMILQFGFYNDWTADLGQAWDKSGTYYDNVKLEHLIIGPAHTGTWYNSSQNGHGFSIEFSEFQNTPLAVVYWYHYDSEGMPLFFTGLGAPVGNRLEVNFDAPFGMRYGEWNSIGSENKPIAGSGVFVFTDRDRATFSYTPGAYAETNLGHTVGITDLPLVKLVGIPADGSFENPVYE